ncbi:MAG: DCC1-like thiol-disulfide oxidoreductase family protein [Planctomycetota bacterium]|nr:DCC1-like thiol-disulfide oxidoreductase family protein [Planctomycetota bacterium]
MSAGEEPIVLFDGGCGLCSRTVRFLLRHDARGRMRFAPLGSGAAEGVLRARGVTLAELPDSVVVVDAAGVHVRSAAALRLASELRAPWSWLRVLAIVPRPLRDLVYRLVARNRVRWFGSADVCAMLAPAERPRFLDGAWPEGDDRRPDQEDMR